jgi:hypothetical protein
MKLPHKIQVRLARIHAPLVALLALLERTPAVRVAAAAENLFAESPAGALIRSAAAALAALGAVDSMAGATILATSLDPTPAGALPNFEATVGQTITPLGFTITNTLTVGSWKVTGNIPPGLVLTTVEPNGGSLTGPGVLDATTAGSAGNGWSGGTVGNSVTTPVLEGTPTTAGTYTFSLQGFAFGGEVGGSGGTFTGTGISAVFPFTVVVGSPPPPAPLFTLKPTSVTVTGGTVALNAAASNATSYQWNLNNTPIVGATSSLLVLPDAASAAGSYTVSATNVSGSVTSSPAVVAVTSTNDVGRLVNISCRAEVGTGGSILIAGFVVGGQGTSGQEALLIRGSGPALAGFGVPGTLPDPNLGLFTGTTQIDMNDAWAGSTAISAAASAVGAFPWTVTSSHDSALVESLAGGAYTAEIAGASNDTGVALIEAYDSTPSGTYTPATPRLVNISARVEVGTGGNILIVGFVVGGSTARTVLIRASGPALAGFGLTGTLPDPKLGLFTGTTEITSNAGWGGNAQITTVANTVGAFTWGSPSSADSALLVTLAPGAYTAEVSGVSGDTGIALVEVYEVP